MGEHRSFWVWFSILCAACALFSYLAVVHAIQGPAPSSLNVSTVRLASDRPGHGSAVHIGNGYLLTAAHVVGTAKQMTVRFSDASIVKAEVLWANPGKDIALLRFRDTGRVASSPLSCRVAEPGEHVTAIGNPIDAKFGQLTFEGRINGGIIQNDGGRWQPSDMTVLPGMSGGGVLDDEGNVVGIVVATAIVPFGMFPSWARIGLMVPAADVCELMGRA